MKISILTASYNRVELLPRLYTSLVEQRNKDFEWVIVDDGSQDNTEGFINSCIEKNEIEIKYIRKENGGKHSAINMAILMSEGDYCLIIDSDDYLKYDAIEVISRHLKNIPSNLSGACFRCQDINGELIGDNADFPNNSTLWVKSNPASFKKFINGDSAYVFKTEHQKRFLFPTIYGERFFPELYIWNQISQNCGEVAYFYKTSICVVEYQSNGLSSNFKKLMRDSPTAFLIYYKDMIYRDELYFNKLKYSIRLLQSLYYFLVK